MGTEKRLICVLLLLLCICPCAASRLGGSPCGAGSSPAHAAEHAASAWVGGQYVKARFVFERVQAIDGSADPYAPPLSLVLPDTPLGKLKISKEAVGEAKRTLQQIAKQFLGGTFPDNTDPVVGRGINMWLAAEIRHGKEKVASTLAHARYADSLLQKLSKRPTEKKKVLVRKQALLARTNAGHAQLLEWCCWAGKLVKGGMVQAWDTELANEISRLAYWRPS